MDDFALVSEGVTDQVVLENILLGYFTQQREPVINRDQPPPQAQRAFGGWTLVLQYLRTKQYQKALLHHRFLIVQVDTDVAEDVGFDVPRQDRNGPIPIDQFIRNVVERLRSEINEEDRTLYGDRFIFAIGVEQLECWLLPLWFAGAKANQTVNCTERLGRCNQLRNELTRHNFKWIQRKPKEHLSYDLASRGYRKRAVLMEQGAKNPSLRVFLEELDRREIRLEALE